MSRGFASMAPPRMEVYQIDPLLDDRWPRFLDCQPKASVFHTRAWLESLAKTYGYRPVVFTPDPPDAPLNNGIVFCEVNSWLTGRRLVSLPFSDHCEPLVRSAQDFHFLLDEIQKCQPGHWKYVEIRPWSGWSRCIEGQSGFAAGSRYVIHMLDLKPSLEELYHRFHGDSIRRKITRAERERLSYEEGRSEVLLKKFYQLLLMTRRRHRLPPQPLNWFCNLVSCLGETLKIRVASKASQPIASIVTLRYKHALVYKYGCSDVRLHNLGGMALLFWKAIQEAKQAGLQQMDFGRSDCQNLGLIAFKDHWGATRSELTYLRFPAQQTASADARNGMQFAKRAFAHTPDRILVLTGKLLYRHMG